MPGRTKGGTLMDRFAEMIAVLVEVASRPVTDLEQLRLALKLQQEGVRRHVDALARHGLVKRTGLFIELGDGPPVIGGHPRFGMEADLAGASEAQRTVAENIAAGPRGSLASPFLAMLAAPGLADAAQRMGAYLRFDSVLPASLREIAILATADAVDCGYEWNYHAPLAAKAGAGAEAIIASRQGQGMQLPDPARTVMEICRALAVSTAIPPQPRDRGIDLLGSDGMAELMGVAGYYRLLATFIKAGDRDVPFAHSDSAHDIG